MTRKKNTLLTADEIKAQIDLKSSRINKLSSDLKRLKTEIKTLERQYTEAKEREERARQQEQYEAIAAFLQENNITIEELWSRLPAGTE